VTPPSTRISFRYLYGTSAGFRHVPRRRSGRRQNDRMPSNAYPEAPSTAPGSPLPRSGKGADQVLG
jgi:hypothetical protein